MCNKLMQRRERIDELLEGSGKITSGEAEELFEDCQQCAIDLDKTAVHLRLLVFAMFRRKGLAVLNMTEDEFRSEVYSVSKKCLHRSTINRQYLAALMDYRLKLPPGEVKESVLRKLRSTVQKDACGDVLQKALEKQGSYRKITALNVVEIAENLGCLTNPTVGKANGKLAKRLTDDDQHAGVEISAEPSPTADPRPETPKNSGQVRSDTDSLDAIKASSPLGRMVAELSRNKRDRNFLRQYLEKSYTNPAQIDALESLDLVQRQAALKLLNNTG